MRHFKHIFPNGATPPTIEEDLHYQKAMNELVKNRLRLKSARCLLKLFKLKLFPRFCACVHCNESYLNYFQCEEFMKKKSLLHHRLKQALPTKPW